jgi:hypothetical protein
MENSTTMRGTVCGCGAEGGSTSLRTLMKKRNTILCVALVSFLLGFSEAATPDEKYVFRILPNGSTTAQKRFGKTRIDLTLKTHSVDIGRPEDGRPEKIETNCTYSVHPCVLVDSVEIQVDGQNIFVPRSVFADLADIGSGSLVRSTKGEIVIELHGGDASEAYTVRIRANRQRVLEREIVSGMDRKAVIEKTIYLEPLTLN